MPMNLISGVSTELTSVLPNLTLELRLLMRLAVGDEQSGHVFFALKPDTLRLYGTKVKKLEYVEPPTKGMIRQTDKKDLLQRVDQVSLDPLSFLWKASQNHLQKLF